MKQRKKLTFSRFRDLQWQDMNCDLHMHTKRTDGQETVKTILDVAVERGLGRVAFTEHVRKDTAWFHEFADEVRAQRAQYPQIEVLVGCEAKALDTSGSLDVSEEILAECEIVLGSVHRFPDGRGGIVSFSDLTQEQIKQTELELALGLLDAAPIDVLAHAGGMYMRRFPEFPVDMMRAILTKSLERGVAVEINSSYLRDIPALLQLCEEINPYVSVASDMHKLERLGECRDRLRTLGIGRA